jgi:type IV pilus assembly protein PilC
MPSFQYEALKISDRSKLNGVINASSEKEAREKLREQELIPTKIKVLSNDLDKTAGAKKKGAIGKFIDKFKGVGLKDKLTFTRNMSMMIKAGIPVTEALLYFENYCKNPQMRNIVSDMRRDLMAGYSFSQAMSKHDKVFDNIFVNITQAGERSGELDETLTRMTTLLIKQGKLRAKVIGAAVYPCIVMFIMFLVLIVMFLLVIPTFQDIYKQMGVKLPLITQVMVAISSALRGYWFISFPILGAAGFGFFKYLKSPAGKTMTDKVFLKVPVLDELTIFVNNSTFVSTLHIAFAAGLPIMDALYLSNQTISNELIAKAFKNVLVQIQTGQKLAKALAATGYVPDMVLLMLSIGEESGELEKMLANSYEFLEEEVNQRVEILTALLEPLMLIVLGVIVCCLALSIYMPLYSMYDKH